MGNYINRIILQFIKLDSTRTGRSISSITPETFPKAYTESCRSRNNICDKLMRWLLTPKECPVPNYKDYMTGVSSEDTSFTFSYLLTTFYAFFLQLCKCNGYWRNNKEMERDLKVWNVNLTTESNSISVETPFFTFIGLAQFYSRSSDLFDILTREGNNFVIDTLYLNKYSYKPGLGKLGCRAVFSLTEDGFHFLSLTYENITYTEDNGSIEVKMALRALYGGTSIIRTILTHATGIHYLASARITSVTQKHMSGKLLEQVLQPCMFKTVNGLARANKTLFSEGAFFDTFGPFTYESLCGFIADYIKAHSTLDKEFSIMQGVDKYWDLDEKEASTLPFRSINTWITHIQNHVNEYVIEALKLQPIEEAEHEWIGEITGDSRTNSTEIKNLIGYMYFLQVRHTYMSDPLLQNILFRYSYNISTESKYKDSYNTKWDHFMKIAVDLSTSFNWIKLTANLSNIISDGCCQNVWNNFYTGLAVLDIDTRLPLIAVDNINCSTGL
jgi:hypothetical protein